MMSILITGVAGFIGTNLAEFMLKKGNRIIGIDNLCRGSHKNLEKIINNPLFTFKKIEMTNLTEFREAIAHFYKIEYITEIWHMAANSDIPAGIQDPKIDLRDTFMTTFNTLQIMKTFGIRVMAFASSSAIYGDLGDRPLVEEIGPLLPISNYGAMKLASEAVISAATENFLEKAYIFRFPNVIGIPATHGVILDFMKKLKNTPFELEVLGDGTQQKSYLHVEELIDAMLFIRNNSTEKLSVFNIGAGDEGVTVRFIAEETVRALASNATISYGKGNKGWIGDVPKFTYSVKKLIDLGWEPRLGSKEAVRKAIRQIIAQETEN